MASIVSIAFPFRGSFHSVLVSVKELNNQVQYRLTIMNGDLEKLLYGCNIINEVNGDLELDDCDGNLEKWELKKQIVTALSAHLNKKVIELPFSVSH
jgi:hypothetical protein